MESVLKEWEFIGQIPIGSKPCFYSKTLMRVDEWFLTVRRRWSGEKGEKGVLYVENLLNNTKQVLGSAEGKEEELAHFQKVLREALIGVNNLVCTYKNDGQPNVAKGYEEAGNAITSLLKTFSERVQKAPVKVKKDGFFGNDIKILSSDN